MKIPSACRFGVLVVLSLIGVSLQADSKISDLESEARAGNFLAQNVLGDHYREGIDVAKDEAKAVYWYTKSAWQGWRFAHYNLGKMYRAGTGVQKDWVQAYAWLKLAADKNVVLAQRALTALEKDMTADQKAAGEKLWAELRNKVPPEKNL